MVNAPLVKPGKEMGRGDYSMLNADRKVVARGAMGGRGAWRALTEKGGGDRMRHSAAWRDQGDSSMSSRSFTVVIEKCPETSLFVGYVPGFPGAHSQGASVEELTENLQEVIAMLLA